MARRLAKGSSRPLKWNCLGRLCLASADAPSFFSPRPRLEVVRTGDPHSGLRALQPLPFFSFLSPPLYTRSPFRLWAPEIIHLRGRGGRIFTDKSLGEIKTTPEVEAREGGAPVGGPKESTLCSISARREEWSVGKYRDSFLRFVTFFLLFPSLSLSRFLSCYCKRNYTVQKIRYR